MNNIINSLLSCKKCGIIVDKRKITMTKLFGISANLWNCPNCKKPNKEWV